MEAYPNAVHRLQGVTLLRLRLMAQREKVIKLRSRAENGTGACGACFSGGSMEDRVIALVDAERRLKALKRAWRVEAASASALIDQVCGAEVAQALKLIYLHGKRAPEAKRVLRLSDGEFAAALKEGLCRIEARLNAEHSVNVL